MTQYARGRRKEWEVVKRLKARGWYAVRSAGSHGLWDVSALKRGVPPLFIQVKYMDGKRPWLDDNARLLRDIGCLGDAPPCNIEVWVFTKGRAAPEVYTPELGARGGGWYWEIDTERTRAVNAAG